MICKICGKEIKPEHWMQQEMADGSTSHIDCHAPTEPPALDTTTLLVELLSATIKDPLGIQSRNPWTV